MIDASLFPPDHPPHGPLLAPPAPGAPADVSQADDGSQIDVMVVYSAAAKTAAGGASAISAQIALAIAETNTSYQNSGVTQRLRLVHSEEVVYTESAHASPDPFTGALNCITSTSDGCLDGIHATRNTYAADLVSFWIDDATYCGMGWLNSTATTGFSVVTPSCATGYYSFGHELGHNMGARHDTYVDPTTTPYAYAHGYVNTAAASPWRTIMAYNNACTAAGKNCTRIQYWSNPAVSYGGAVMGTADTADNHRVLNATALAVANFRVAATLYPITTTASPALGGSVSCSPNPVASGGSSTCTATPNSGYSFSSWSGDCTGASCSFTNVQSAKSVTASFAATGSSRLLNLATRAPVLTGDNVMIAGFIIEGNAPQTVLIRARGPSMSGPPHNVPGTLPNPFVQLYSGQTVIASNDNWGDATNASAISATGLAPSDPLESAILITLNPGAYTAIVTGVGGGAGIGIVEVFAR